MSACPPEAVGRPTRPATIAAGAPAINRRFTILRHSRHRPAAAGIDPRG